MYRGYKFDALAIAWFLFSTVLSVVARSNPEHTDRFRGYLFATSIAGLAGVFWALHEVDFSWWLIAPEYAVAIACAVGMFFICAGLGTPPVRVVARSIPSDGYYVLRHAFTWAAISLFIGVFALQPRPATATPRSIPTGADFEKWFAQQPRSKIQALSGEAGAVLITKFNDYQCPPCKRAHLEYGALIADLQSRFPGKIRLITRDYPLNAQCNPYASDLHPGACVAAVAMRLATAKGTAKELEDWLWAHQTAGEAAIIQAARSLAKVDDLESKYEAEIVGVKGDIEIAHAASIPGTPTFFVNGVSIPLGSRTDFETAVRYELRSVTLQQ